MIDLFAIQKNDDIRLMDDVLNIELDQYLLERQHLLRLVYRSRERNGDDADDALDDGGYREAQVARLGPRLTYGAGIVCLAVVVFLATLALFPAP